MTAPSNSVRRPALDDPNLLPFLPLLYVAWADGDLAPEEISAICRELRLAKGGAVRCGDFLGGWLDPEHPPSAAELAGLLRRIREAGRGLSPRLRRSLTQLGAELAGADHALDAAEQQALAAIEAAFGIAGHEAARRLLDAKPAPPEEVFSELDSRAMQRLLDGRFADIRNRVRRLLSHPEFAYRHELPRNEYRTQVTKWCQRLASEGLGALSFPAACGGAEDPGAFVAVFETLATHDLSLLVKFGVQFGLFGGSILQLGTERHHRQYLPAAGSMELPGCFAMTETGHGSNVRDIDTEARYDAARREFILHTPHGAARKDYIGNAALDGRLATVFAQLTIGDEEHGVHAFLVPIRSADGAVAKGVEIEDCGPKLGLNGVDNGRLRFDRVRVPRENLLNRFADVAPDGTYTSPINSPSRRFFTMLGTLVGGRVSVALAGLSTAKSALAIGVRYGGRRRQFGPAGEAETPLLDYLTHQRRLLPRLATTYALDFALKHLADLYLDSPGEERREVESEAAGLKAFATWHATDTIQTCRECCGGQGYLAENRLAAIKADSDVFTTFEGDNFVLMQLVAKSLLTGYRRQFSDLNLLAVARFLAERATTALAELNPVVTRLTDEDHLRGAEFQTAAFRWREDHLLSSLARRLKRRIDRGEDSYTAFVACQDHAVATARAHVERVILEQFVAGAERCEETDLRSRLDELRSLFALSRLEQDRGWFQEHGYLESAKAKAIRKQVRLLCGEVRPHAVALVDAFGIPDALLAAPIALR